MSTLISNYILQVAKQYQIHLMTAALVRRNGKGVLALALSSSPLISTCAFTTSSTSSRFLHRWPSLTSLPSTVLRSQSTSASRKSDTGDLVEIDYEWLKQSRPMRIQARAIVTSNGDPNTTGTRSASSGVTKIVHFQRHGQGKFCTRVNFDHIVTRLSNARVS